MAEQARVYRCPRCNTIRPDVQRFCAACAFDFWGAAAGRSGDPEPVHSRHESLMAKPNSMGVPDTTTTAGRFGLSGAAVSVILGGALMAIGSILPWISTSSAGGELAYSGVDGGGDGWITLSVGLGVIGLVLVARRGADDFNRLAIWLLSLVALGLFWINLGRVSEAVTAFEANARGLANASIGFGLWVIAVGAIVAFGLNIGRARARSGPGGFPNLLPF